MDRRGVSRMDGRGLIYLLKEHKQFASPAERNIIDYVQGNPREASMQSIQSLAEATYTSPSTVVRLCRKLGCDGYKEFRRELIYELALYSSPVVVRGFGHMGTRQCQGLPHSISGRII